MLKSRQRVWNALNLKTTGRPPKGEIYISDETIKDFSLPSLQELLLYLNADIVTLQLDKINDWNCWRQYEFFIFGLIPGPFTLMLELMNWKKVFSLIVNRPDETRSLMGNLITSYNSLISSALDEGCGGIIIADDLAGKQGLLLSPVYLQNYYFPVISQLIELFGNKVPFIFHSDGNIIDIIAPAKRAGFWGIHSLQPSVGININSFDRSLLSDWVFWGNFEYEAAEQMKTTFQIQQEVKNLLSSWNNVPGYIFGSSGGLYQGIPSEAIKTAYDMIGHFKD